MVVLGSGKIGVFVKFLRKVTLCRLMRLSVYARTISCEVAQSLVLSDNNGILNHMLNSRGYF